MSARPDIVLLILDTQRFDRLSCYGYGRETSPHLDEFAADATLFRHAVSTAQWTIPSHTSMFTGLYPSAHTMLHASSILPATLTTLAERLSAGGYFTTAFCNNPLLGVVNNGLRRGFYSFLNYGGLMTSRPNQVGVHPHLFDRYRKHFKRWLATVLTAMQDAFAHSDTLLDLSFSPLMVPLWQTALRFKGNTGKALNDAAQILLERKGVPEDQPIFSFINLMGTHMPYHPPRRYVARFAPHVLNDKSARHYLRRFNSDVFGWLAPLSSEIDAKEKATLDGMYDAEVAYQDELLGGFFERLRAGGRLDNTLVIICADHGEHLGEKQLMGHSIALYDTLVHVPLLIRDPDGGLPKGGEVERVVSTRRVFHTVLTSSGLASESERALTLTHEATTTNAQQAGTAVDALVFAEGILPQNALNLLQRHRPTALRENNYDKPRRAVWSGQYKFIQTGEDIFETEPGAVAAYSQKNLTELYNIFDDENENVNLRDILPEQVEIMQEYLQLFLKHVGEMGTETLAEELTDYNDQQVYNRLRALGYLE